MKQLSILFSSIIIVVVVFSGCNNNRVFESYVPVFGEGWQKDSMYSFTFNILDSAQNYNVYFNLRNSIGYQYSNIWLFVSINTSEQKLFSDTLEFALADRSGRWLGNGHGKFRDNKLLYRRSILFPDKGEYNLNIQHGMRQDLLEGINDIGISIEKVN